MCEVFVVLWSLLEREDGSAGWTEALLTNLLNAGEISGFHEEVYQRFSRIGVMVSVLANGPIVGGLKPGRGDGFLRAIKSAARLPAEGK
jgi:hypothetical protein